MILCTRRQQQSNDQAAETYDALTTPIGQPGFHRAGHNPSLPNDGNSFNFDVQILRNPNNKRFVWITNFSFEKSRKGTVIIPGYKSEIHVDLLPGDSKVVELVK